ncbi:hypothetical protein [Streptosporangium lutulentum]|uniref:Uncharacterized protein n=1 Tax=Streptosporangium lutulentum TaxID=1461250 RepID=A0ABT9QTD0_9ACTN|nr:hypothetical protein [Streptosporangium lutulentum]MDP9850001.1 hypothetical protein [Streptosporangium lutulentum]
MYLITARLRAPGGDDRRPPPATRMRACELRDLVLALAAPADRIEHVYGAASPAGVDLGVFVLQPTFDDAESVVDRLCRRCVEVTPRLAGWSLDGCGAGLAPGIADAVLLSEAPGSVLPLQAAASRRDLPEN